MGGSGPNSLCRACYRALALMLMPGQQDPPAITRVRSQVCGREGIKFTYLTLTFNH